MARSDRDTLGQQVLQHALHGRDTDLARDQVIDQLAVGVRQLVQQLPCLRVGQQVGHVILQHLGQMRRDHRGCIDDRQAAEAGFLPQGIVHPLGRQAECGLHRVLARHVDVTASGIEHHQLVGADIARAGFHFLDADGIGVRAELHVVENADTGHDEAHVGGDLATQGADLVGQLRTIGVALHQFQQAVADFQPQVVDGQDLGDRLLGGFGGGIRVRAVHDFGIDRRYLPLSVQDPGPVPGSTSQDPEGNERNARQQRERDKQERRYAERRGIATELAEQGLVGGPGDTGLGDQQTGSRGDDQCRDLGDQAITDGQQGIGLPGFHEAHVILGDTDDDAADDIDEGDHQTGDGVTADELGCTIHGTEERAFVLQVLAPGAGLVFVDQARREVGVDRHLLAGHGVQREARGDFRDAPRTLGDDDEVHDHQDREDDDADDEIAAHDEIAKGFDDLTGGVSAIVPLRQDQPGRGHVQCQPYHGGNQQDGGEGTEFQWLLDEQTGHQHHHREGDGDGQAEVQQPARHGQDQDDQDGNDTQGQRNVAAPGELAQQAKRFRTAKRTARSAAGAALGYCAAAAFCR